MLITKVFLLFLVSASSVLSNCVKIKCRYKQKSKDIDFKSDVYNRVEDEKSAPKKYSKTTATGNKKLCFNYVSSFSINQHDMDKMRDCAIIDLSSNEIKTIDRMLFVKHEQLELLNLDENHLKELPENVFDDLVNLRNLTLSRNYLETLSTYLFKFNLLLENLDVSNNKLVKISSSMFDHLSELKFISFRHNYCIDLEFPENSLNELKNVINSNCGEKSLINFIIKLIKISTLVHKGAFQDHGVIPCNNEDQATIETIIQIQNVTEAEKNSTSSTNNNENDLDILLTSLFWLVIPIILILFAILAAISYAIYNKYFVYAVDLRPM